MTSSAFYPASIYILCIYFTATFPPQFGAYPRDTKRKNYFNRLKKQGPNRQYQTRMTVDKRFRQNHTKYLHFKAFR